MNAKIAVIARRAGPLGWRSLLPLLCMLAASAVAAAQAGRSRDVDDLAASPELRRGMALMAHRQYAEALGIFNDLNSQYEVGDTRLNIVSAQCEIGLLRWANAFARYDAMLRPMSAGDPVVELRRRDLGRAWHEASRHVAEVHIGLDVEADVEVIPDDPTHFGALVRANAYVVDADVPIALTLRAEGFEDERLTITLNAGEVRSLSPQLRPTVGYLSISVSPLNALVSVDGASMSTPLRNWSIRTGSHRIDVTAAGFLSRHGTAAVARGEHVQLDVILDPLPAATRETGPSTPARTASPVRSVSGPHVQAESYEQRGLVSRARLVSARLYRPALTAYICPRLAS